MRTETQPLKRPACFDFFLTGQAPDITELRTYVEQLEARTALTQPVPPAEGGEAVYWEVTTGMGTKVEVIPQVEFTKRSFDTGRFRPLVYGGTAPPASQEQAAPAWSDAVCDAGFQAMEARGFRVGASDIGKDDMKAMFLAMAEAAKASQEQAQQPIKDHQIAQIVNQLRDIAIEFHMVQQLRERIAHVIVPVLKAQQPTLGALGKRRIFDAIRGAYDLGFSDARNAKTVPGDGAPGYKGRDVEADHGEALLNSLNHCIKLAQQPDHLPDAGKMVQQPSGGEVKAAPVESYPAQDQAFYAFWYSHMKGDLMQPPLADISHSTARYIWDSALATPKPEPMTDEQIANVVLQTVYAGDDSTPHRNAWAREIGIPFARAIEAHHGITKGSESAACSVCEGKGHVYRDGRCVGFCRCPAGRNALALNIPPAPITKGEA